MGRAGEVLSVRSDFLQASWRETQVGHYVSLGLLLLGSVLVDDHVN